MRVFATYHGGQFGGTLFPTRKAAESYPGPRGFEGGYKTITELVSAEWQDATLVRPPPMTMVLLYRVGRYEHIVDGNTVITEGHKGCGLWTGEYWVDLMDAAFKRDVPVTNVGLWHEISPGPITNAQAKAEEERLKAFLAAPD